MYRFLTGRIHMEGEEDNAVWHNVFGSNFMWRNEGSYMRLRIGKIGLQEAKLPVLPLFCISLVAGILVMNIGKSILLKDTGLFDEYTLYTMKYMTVDSNALFSYVLRERLVRLLILAVLSTTYLGLVICAGTVIWYGMSAGVFLSALALRYGIKGLFLAVVAVFPHYLLYAPALFALIVWCETLYRGIYGRTIDLGEDKVFLPKKLGRLAIIFGVAVVACFLEAYVNPLLLLSYLKVF